MASSGNVTASRERRALLSPVGWTRIAIVVVLLVGWEALSRSGLLYRDVVPSLGAIARSFGTTLASGGFYGHLGATLVEIAFGLAIGGGGGLVAGLVLGRSRFLQRAYEPYLYYLGPTPKIIFFPVLIMLFGVGSGSKVAMGALSCFFPVALSVAVGLRGIDRVFIRVGQSFRLTGRQMVTKVYLPALREPILNGLRLGLGVATVGTLLAETKLSNRGLGFLVIQNYQRFDMPAMYALLIIIFMLAIVANLAIGRIAGPRVAARR